MSKRKAASKPQRFRYEFLPEGYPKDSQLLREQAKAVLERGKKQIALVDRYLGAIANAS